MMSNLVERFEAVLRGPSGSPWLPELTKELVENCWHDLYRHTGLSPANYGTGRLVARDYETPCTVLPMSLSSDEERTLQVEILSGDIVRYYKEAGVNFFSIDEIGSNLLGQIREAIKIIRQIPSLFTTVAALVKSIHIIKLEDDDFDVSFSEPHIPFSIFVSVPRTRSSTNALRVAEAIVHEAMHLQLTLLERILPLIKPTSQKYYSPWRGEFRNAQGMLHGLYVFCVVGELMRELQTLKPNELIIDGYRERRMTEIHNQIISIKSFQESEDLTEIGAKFTRWIITGFKVG